MLLKTGVSVEACFFGLEKDEEEDKRRKRTPPSNETKKACRITSSSFERLSSGGESVPVHLRIHLRNVKTSPSADLRDFPETGDEIAKNAHPLI